MSQDMLGPLPRALVGVPEGRLPLMLDIANKVGDEKSGDAWHRHLSKTIRAGLPVPTETPTELPPLLVFDDAHIASVDISKPHNPDTFWRTTKESPARYVYHTFLTDVVARALPSSPSGIVKVPYADPSRNTNVREILDAQGVGDHDPSKLSALIASMISEQPNGEFSKDGLLNDGRANLFPCGSVLVRVRWDDDDSEWDVYDWSPDDDVSAGRRVFSGNLKL